MECTKQELLRLFRELPENVFLMYAHCGRLYFVRHAACCQNTYKESLPYRNIESAHNELQKITDRLNINLTSVHDITAIEKQFFSCESPYARFAIIQDDELAWIPARYPWDYVFVYIAKSEPEKKRRTRKSKTINEPESGDILDENNNT